MKRKQFFSSYFYYFLINALFLCKFTNQLLIEKCYNGPEYYNYTRNDLDGYFYPSDGFVFQKSDILKKSVQVQILATHTYLDTNYNFFNRSLILNGNSSSWNKYSKTNFFPSSNKIACQEKILCANSNTIIKICQKCNWFGQIISQSACRKNLINFKDEIINFANLCSEFSEMPVPMYSAFRIFATSQNWDFEIISEFNLVIIEKPDISECKENLPYFVCYDINQQKTNVSEYFSYDLNGVFQNRGKINPLIFNNDNILYESEDNSRIKLLSLGNVNIQKQEYEMIDYSSQWINSSFLVDCGSIDPDDPIDPNNPDDNGKPSGIGGFMIFLIIIAILAVLTGAGYGVFYYIKEKRKRDFNNFLIE